MKRRTRNLLVLVLGAAALVTVAVWLFSAGVSPHFFRQPKPEKSAVLTPTRAGGLSDRLTFTSKVLATRGDAGVKRDALQELVKALAANSTNDASKAIQRFLDSKADASTGVGWPDRPGCSRRLRARDPERKRFAG